MQGCYSKIFFSSDELVNDFIFLKSALRPDIVHSDITDMEVRKSERILIRDFLDFHSYI